MSKHDVSAVKLVIVCCSYSPSVECLDVILYHAITVAEAEEDDCYCKRRNEY